MRDLLRALDTDGIVLRRIRLCTDGRRFDLDPEGVEAVIIGVADYAECYDAAAFLPGEPTRWWLGLGNATLLGERAVRRAAFEGRPIELVETPQRWLHRTTVGGDCCACILDWSVDPRLNLAWVKAVECESSALQQRLASAIARHAQPPFRITARRERAQRAA